MGASKSYYLKLQEEEFENMPMDEQTYLMRIGMTVRQIETEVDKDDPHYKELRKARLKAWDEEQEYLFKKRNNMHGT